MSPPPPPPSSSIHTHCQQAQTWGHAAARAVRATTVTHSLRTCVYAQISIRRRLNYSWICWLGLFARALAHDQCVVCGGLKFGRPIHDLFSGTMRLVLHFCIFDTTNAYDWVRFVCEIVFVQVRTNGMLCPYIHNLCTDVILFIYLKHNLYETRRRRTDAVIYAQVMLEEKTPIPFAVSGQRRIARVYFISFLQMFAFWQNAKQIIIYMYRYIYACISICTYMYVYILCVLWLCEYTIRFPSRQPDEWICDGLKLASLRATLFSSPHSFYAHTEEKTVGDCAHKSTDVELH